ncbi:MAG: hypothetical protein D8M58_17295 [Calditrichaeota bacterium]|nr:MAG: hypothetical protein DWQ03_12425 [Calditrichota bacterium]MBL1207164.1 hypothetical protein [Calditrichota bacterium]NOG46996.1 hypothetical protein [Calditrichota bacterium]
MKKVILIVLLFTVVGYSGEWKAQTLKGMNVVAYIEDGERFASIIKGPGLSYTMYVPEYNYGNFGYIMMHVDLNYKTVCNIEGTIYGVTKIFISREDIPYMKKGRLLVFKDDETNASFIFKLTGFTKAWNQTF